MQKTMEQSIAEQATGCSGSGGYRQWAKDQGYPHCEVVDWTSSAGDWTFIVSQDGEIWHIMSQSNNYPRGGFTRAIDEQFWVGTDKEVLQQITDLFY